MSDRATSIGKALSLMIVSMIALGGAAALVGTLSSPARAATCDQGGSIITGDWTVATAQVCTGILYTVDGSITINSGGSLTLVNGGLSFAKDATHVGYSLTVNSGGVLILDNSIVTVQTNAIDPYLKLALTVTSGTFTMRNGAVLKFPGWFNATGATISVTGSAITGFLPADIAGTGLDASDNDNSPLLHWSSTTAALFQSQIARIYENTNTGAEGNVALVGGSTMYAYDSYIAADFSNQPGLHNEIQVDATSSAFLYNVTIDESETPIQQSNWLPAYNVTVAGGFFDLLRWARVSVVDATGFPVSGATIWSAASPSAVTAQYPDNSNLAVPSARTLSYLGKTTGNWNTTDVSGNAVIPLFTDQITTASLPNAASFGNYQLTASFSGHTAVAGVNFNPYPAITWPDNNAWVTIPMNDVQIRTGPDVALHQSDYPLPKSVIQNQDFTVNALVYNQGQTVATAVSVAAWLNGSSSREVGRASVASIAPGGMANITMNVTKLTAPGPYTLELVADPNNTIDEGGFSQENNNFANITLNVIPPPAGFLAIGSPTAGGSFTPGTVLSVTGNVKNSAAQPIEGVPVTAQLWQGSTLITESNPTVTDTNGNFETTLTIPSGSSDGSYTVRVVSSVPTIVQDQISITVQAPASFLVSPVPLLGIAWWLFLVILAAIVAVAVGLTLYFKVYGLGKMVECGECGSFIPEDATVCPRCGVEFEKDMAKCSNCQAWIPVDVKQCPECGIEFATGELDMADYQEKMRLQYDEVVQKLKTEAQRTLRRTLSEAEFQEWWRKQPTFLTFEDWLKEEEEVRKKGSRPCPVCGTLNSLTAKVCHTCGSLIQAQATRPTTPGATRVGAPKRAIVRPQVAQPAPPPAEEGEAPTEEPAGPVVQKKIVRRTPEEGGESGTEDQGDQSL